LIEDSDVPSLTAGDVARLTGGSVLGDASTRLAGVAPLESAGSGELSFLASRRFLEAFHGSAAEVVLVGAELKDIDNGRSTRIIVDDPYRAITVVIAHLRQERRPAWGIDAYTSIGKAVRWSGRISIARGVQIGSRVSFGDDCVVGAGTTIGNGVSVGDHARIGSHVTIVDDVVLGNQVTIHSGARIGTDGFGYRPGEFAHCHVRHVGGCVLHSGVDIGANTTVDRGTLGDTVIGEQTKIDNLVHVAHNCRIGKRCLIMAQVGMAGSTTVEDDVILAGQAGLAGHLTIGSKARVAAQAGVIGDVLPAATVSGYPARDHREVLRQTAAARRLARHVKALEHLAKQADLS